MSLNLDRSTWKRVKLGDVVLRSRAQADPFKGQVDRYVAGGHIDTDSVIISRSGEVTDGQMGSTFRYAFQPGQVLFVSARPYLRKTGVPNFDGVVADKTYVLEAVPANGLLQDMLPFLLTSDRFVEYATQEATGSMNPRLLWGAMQRYEFDLPPLDDQKRIAGLLWAVERHQDAMAWADESLKAFQVPLMAIEAPTFVTVGDVVAIARSGATPLRSNNAFYGGVIPWLKSGEVVSDRIAFTEETITEEGLAGSATWLVPAGAIVVAMYGDGKTRGQVGRLGVSMATNQAVLALVPDETKCDPDFLYYWLRSRQEELRNKGAGAAQKNLSKGLVVSEPFPGLSVNEQRTTVQKIMRIDVAREELKVELNRVLVLRSSLLAEVFGAAE